MNAVVSTAFHPVIDPEWISNTHGIPLQCGTLEVQRPTSVRYSDTEEFHHSAGLQEYRVPLQCGPLRLKSSTTIQPSKSAGSHPVRSISLITSPILLFEYRSMTVYHYECGVACIVWSCRGGDRPRHVCFDHLYTEFSSRGFCQTKISTREPHIKNNNMPGVAC